MSVPEFQDVLRAGEILSKPYYCRGRLYRLDAMKDAQRTLTTSGFVETSVARLLLLLLLAAPAAAQTDPQRMQSPYEARNGLPGSGL